MKVIIMTSFPFVMLCSINSIGFFKAEYFTYFARRGTRFRFRKLLRRAPPFVWLPQPRRGSFVLVRMFFSNSGLYFGGTVSSSAFPISSCVKMGSFRRRRTHCTAHGTQH